MASVFDNIKSINDYKREEEEFNLRKQKISQGGGGGMTPAALQVAESIQADLDASNRAGSPEEAAAYRQRANLKAQSAKMFDRGLNPYGGGETGGMVLPENPVSLPVQQAPQGLLPQMINAIQGRRAPAAPSWNNPDAQQIAPAGVEAIPGYSSAMGSIEADKKGMGRQAEKNVDLRMNPQIAAGEAAAKLNQQLKYEPDIKAATTTADIAAKSRAESLAAQQKKAFEADNALALIKEAETLLPQSTNDLTDRVGNFFNRQMGVSTDRSKADKSLQVIAAGLTSAVPRFEGPQGVLDVELYKQAAADVANTEIPFEDRAAAAATMRDLQYKYKEAAAQTTPPSLNQPEQTNIVLPKEISKVDPSKIPMAAVKDLKNNPNSAAQFDQIFGQGASKMVLGR